MAKQVLALDGSDPQEESVRLLALIVRLMLPSQTATILELNRAGFSPARIAELVGTTRGTANVTIQKNKDKARTISKVRLQAMAREDEERDG